MLIQSKIREYYIENKQTTLLKNNKNKIKPIEISCMYSEK